MSATARELARLDRRLKVLEDTVRQGITRVPGGTDRWAEVEERFKNMDRILLPKDRVNELDDQSRPHRQGTVRDVDQRQDVATVLFDGEDDPQRCSGRVLRRIVPQGEK
jgi:hypothetical protein